MTDSPANHWIGQTTARKPIRVGDINPMKVSVEYLVETAHRGVDRDTLVATVETLAAEVIRLQDGLTRKGIDPNGELN